MISILFVDDEPSILQGIRRVTRSMRDEWDMHFCEGGEAGLTLLGQVDIDVVVSDMRMPGMDGSEFLGHVRELHPGAARIILSGYAEEEAVFRSTRVAHQFLTKPCDVRELRRTILRIQTCREIVEPQAIRDLVGGITELPALGNVHDQLMVAIEDDSSTSESLGAIVSSDVALTAELLRLINSTFFGLSREVESAAQAIGFLGFDVVRAIVVGHSLFHDGIDPIIDMDQLGHRARTVAALTRSGVRSNGGTSKECAEAYLTGMLHEIGALVLARLPEFSDDVLQSVLQNGDLTTERLEFEVDRFVVGAYLLGLWGFSTSVVGSISALSDTVEETHTPIGRALALARQVATAPIDLSGDLTEVQLTSLLSAAENDTLLEVDITELAA